MRYKRDESFRYDFKPSLEGTFEIVQMNEKAVQVSAGTLFIVNLSPSGVGIKTHYNLPDPELYTVTLQLTCTLEDSPLVFKGNVQWKRQSSVDYSYGLELSSSEETKKEIVSLLKRHALNQATST
ncbi:PilZ domain-containing protein [Alkalicoccobacillus plakortidis]|uniref:PilZ domain-containing protein n=1 Tax=Alkalicoccobacillus plakortidis TaxID=444060 RepID=A0ABT0XR51_9BACI|nr:PilZ domain-containing protein [Alkalicoccobacillus plakortidis]MCM2677772.1 PilZ domain-containing protein [Alkalicoccobacillus plakortidis]